MTVRQSLPPHGPQRVFARCSIAVLLEPLCAFPLNSPAPLQSQPRSQRLPGTTQRILQHVEIVNLTEQVLQPLQVGAPTLVMRGQKVLDGVAKALQAQTQLVPRGPA